MGGGGPRARYGAMENGNVLLHSYELINKKGTYTKGSLSDSFICLSPGMVVSTKVIHWPPPSFIGSLFSKAVAKL